MRWQRLGVLATVAALAIPLASSAADKAVAQRPAIPVALPVERPLPSLDGATGWLNSPPLTVAGLRGKVVLVDIWTYTCINWLRSLPYVRAWAAKYKDHGLVVIGVHDPEFVFERNADNVRRAVTSMRIDYPVAIDNDYAIWRGLDNEYWPALYLADAQGNVRYRHFGEGSYEQSERAIQQMLIAAGAVGVPRDLVTVSPEGLEIAASWDDLRSPERYLGYERTEQLVSPANTPRDRSRAFTAPARLALNQWAMAGDWTLRKDRVSLDKPNGRIVYSFHARDLHLVMGPAAPGSSIRIRVKIDGQPPGAAHGVDIDEMGNGTVTDQRLYQLIRQPAAVRDRQFEIEFLDPGVEAFAFTFG